MTRALYRASEDDPAVRAEPDERQIVLAKIRRVMAERGLSYERAVRVVLGNDATARAWLGGDS